MSEFFLKAFNTIMAFIHWGVLKLVPRSHPILGEVANPIVFGSQQGIYWLAQKMFKLMKDERGIGLAGPQCGVPLRIFVMYIERNRYVCINPEIIDTHGPKELDREGCLSFPGEEYMVPRYPKIEVRYQTTTGKFMTEVMEGTKARCFQHELDHLNGITFHKRSTYNY